MDNARKRSDREIIEDVLADALETIAICGPIENEFSRGQVFAADQTRRIILGETSLQDLLRD